jgi:hypothetical protein
MPIVGFIPPTKDSGLVILSPFYESGSMEAVLNRVRLLSGRTRVFFIYTAAAFFAAI